MTRAEKTSFFLFFLLPFFFLYPTLTSSQSFFARDLTYLFHPWRVLSSQMVQGGEMPLWNSFQMGGMPFLANCQSSVLYPFTLLFFLFEFAGALKIFTLLHYALAGLGFYLLGRKLGFTIWASVAGGIVFAYNGYALTRVEFLSVLGSLIWFPWILIFCVQGLQKKGWFGVLIALLLSFSLFAGFPQILVLEIAGAILFTIFSGPWKKALTFWSFIFFIFILFSSLQWLPTWELWSRSIRSGQGISMEEAGMYSLPVGSLWGLLVPNLIFNNPDQFAGEKFFWVWSAWWGILASGFAVLAVRSGPKRLGGFACFLGLAGLGWSLGTQWPIFQWVHRHFFLLRLFRYPPVALFWTVSAVSILVLCGFETLSKLSLNVTTQNWLKVAAVLGMVLELLFYSRNFIPTIDPQYFHLTFDGVKAVLLERHGTVLLSPKVDHQRRLAGMTDLEARMRFRAYLFDLSNLPYRIKTMIPSGEPLALESFRRIREKLAKGGSLSQLREFLNFLDVTYFLTNDRLDPSWHLVGQDRDLNVYQNPQAMGEIFALGKKDGTVPQEAPPPLLPRESQIANQKISVLFDLNEASMILFHVPDYPGWELYCADCPEHHQILKIQEVQGIFQGAICPSGTHRLYLVYRPETWRRALACSGFTFLSLLGLGGWAVRRGLSQAV